MSTKLGMNAKMYYLTGTRATWGAADADGIHGGAAPSGLTELGNVRDVTLNLEQGEADVTTRSNDGWRATEPTLKDHLAQAKAINAKCPISGKDIDATKTSEYKKQLIAFCCADCKPSFDKDPAKYVKKN